MALNSIEHGLCIGQTNKTLMSKYHVSLNWHECVEKIKIIFIIGKGHFNVTRDL